MALVALSLSGMRHAVAEEAKPSTGACQTLARLELFFGAGSSQKPVSHTAFARFLAREVTPRFPQGLSLFEGTGQWRDSKGRSSQEASRLLLIFYVPDTESNEKIEAIRQAYKRRFHQQSVLRADGTSCVSF